MFLSTDALPFIDGHCDISFEDSRGWRSSEFDDDLRTLQFAFGDVSRGPLVMLAAMSVGLGDEQKFPPIIHMHRSDSFRTIVKGHFDIGRQTYSNGVARLQESGTYYGPEQPAAASIVASEDIWSLLVFADKRGHRVHPADKKYRPLLDSTDEEMEPFYRRLGVDEVLPADSSGEPNVQSNPPLPLRAGYADMDFSKDDTWLPMGQSHVSAAAMGALPQGPIILALSAPPGSIAMPGLSWSGDIFIAVTGGAATIGGRQLAVGGLRLVKSGHAVEEICAGPDGLNAYLILSDRATPSPAGQGEGDARIWVDRLGTLLRPLFDEQAVPAGVL